MKYTDTHEWIQQNEDIGILGITQFAREELGEIVYIQLPEVGFQVKAGEEIAVLESTKAAADIYSPISGRVIAVNTKLQNSIDEMNSLPESEGWLVQIYIENPEELTHLLSEEDYLRLITQVKQ